MKIKWFPLLRAMFFAAVAYVRIYPLKEALTKGISMIGFIRMLITLRPIETASDKVYDRRMWHCWACEMFDKERGTCGTAGQTYDDPDTNRKETLGCWCHMPSKAAIKSADCWLAEKGMRGGWPDELR